MRKKNDHISLPNCRINRLSQTHLSFTFAGADHWLPITSFSRGTRGRLAHAKPGESYRLELYRQCARLVGL